MVIIILCALAIAYGLYGLLAARLRGTAEAKATIVDLRKTFLSYEPIVEYEIGGEKYTRLADAGMRRLSSDSLGEQLTVRVYTSAPGKLTEPTYLCVGAIVVGAALLALYCCT